MSLRRSARTASAIVPAESLTTLAATAASMDQNPANASSVKKKPSKAKAKASVTNGESTADSMPPPPSTPARKRKRESETQVSSARKHKKKSAQTSKPAAAPITPAPYSTGDIDDINPPPATPRPALPHMTNAPLQTPHGTRVLPRAASPSLLMTPAGGARNPLTTTTENILEKACDHLISVDPKLKALIDANPCSIFSPKGLAEPIDPFRSLVSGICGQQVSGAAAQSIKNKFVALYNTATPPDVPHTWPTPKQVASTDIPTLRSAGLSQRKAEYVQGLAEKFVSGELSARMLAEASDEEVMEKLIAVRGLGKWSVEMFACFALKRMDILSTGDLGVQRGMAAYVGRDVAKLKAKGGGKWKYMSEQDMLDISAKFAPYRSLFMWLMWRVEDVNVEVMQKP